MRIKSFVEYILESKGISDICLEYKNIIWKLFYDKMKEVLSNGNYSGQIIFSFKDEQFKIVNLMININLYDHFENICNAKFNGTKTSIRNNIFYNPIIEFDIYFKKFNKQFFRYIESIILHELLHCYQMYKLENKKMPNSWQYGSILSKLRYSIREKDSDIDKIIDLIYYSLDHEINAQLHQYYDYILKNEEYDKIFHIENELRNYKIPNKVSDDFIFLMKIIIKNYNNSLESKSSYTGIQNKSLWKYDLNKNNIESFLRSLKKYFTNSANYLSKKIRQINRKVENFEHIDYTMLLTENEIFYKIIKKN